MCVWLVNCFLPVYRYVLRYFSIDDWDRFLKASCLQTMVNVCSNLLTLNYHISQRSLNLGFEGTYKRCCVKDVQTQFVCTSHLVPEDATLPLSCKCRQTLGGIDCTYCYLLTCSARKKHYSLQNVPNPFFSLFYWYKWILSACIPCGSYILTFKFFSLTQD